MFALAGQDILTKSDDVIQRQMHKNKSENVDMKQIKRRHASEQMKALINPLKSRDIPNREKS